MAQEQEIKEEISKLQKQKLKLMDEIDALETKLNTVKANVAIKGKITLQCGTEIMIEPQFHLKLDPNTYMSAITIAAVIDTPIPQWNDGININGYTTQIFGRNGPCRVIELWRRWTPLGLD